MREAPQTQSAPARQASADQSFNGPVGLAAVSSQARPQPFRVEVRKDRQVIHVVPIGELDLATVGQVEERLREFRDADFRCFVLDLRKVTFIDLTGLRLAVQWDACAKRDGIEFALITGPAVIQRAFEITGLLNRLTFRTH